MISTKLCVPAGGAVQDSAGELPAPSQVYLLGMTPSARLELLRVMTAAGPRSPGGDCIHAGVAITNSATLTHCNALKSLGSVRMHTIIADELPFVQRSR